MHGEGEERGRCKKGEKDDGHTHTHYIYRQPCRRETDVEYEGRGIRHIFMYKPRKLGQRETHTYKYISPEMYL